MNHDEGAWMDKVNWVWCWKKYRLIPCNDPKWYKKHYIGKRKPTQKERLYHIQDGKCLSCKQDIPIDDISMHRQNKDWVLWCVSCCRKLPAGKPNKPAAPSTKKKIMYAEQDGLCRICKLHFPVKELTIHHIHKQSMKLTYPNGPENIHERENLELLCRPCHIELHKNERKQWRIKTLTHPST